MSIRLICDKLLHPPLWVLLLVPFLSFSALIFVFAASPAPGPKEVAPFEQIRK